MQKLQWIYIKNISRWLCAQNHHGEFQAEHLSVIKAEEFTKEFIEYTDCWSELVIFFNYIAIALQNIYEFGKAAERIWPYVHYFSNLTHNPFGSGNITGRYIGGLFGSYSQSLFFNSHCWFYKTHGVRFDDEIKEAFSYSELSDLFFDKKEDLERQNIYRVHGYLQQAVLLGDSSALENARLELSKKFNLDVLMKEFFENPTKTPPNEIYVLSAFLKIGWLSGEKYDFGLKSKYIKKSIGKFPPKHPYEQILGYLVLMGIEKEFSLEVLKNQKWPQNIIKVIVLVFMLQNHWLEKKEIKEELLRDLRSFIDDRLMSPWIQYGIIEQLGGMNSDSYKGIGQISVLPFNYA